MIVLSLSIYIYLHKGKYTEEYTSCLYILPDIIINILPVLCTVLTMSFQQPCKPHVYRV